MLIFLTLILISAPTHQQKLAGKHLNTNLKNVFGTPDEPFNVSTARENLSSKKCKTDDGRDGICVKSTSCDSSTNNQITDWPPLGDISHEGPCGNYLDICCPTSYGAVPPAVQADSSYPGCGYSNSGGFFLKTNGSNGEAQFGEFPWMVALLKNIPPNVASVNSDYIGGGSLIHWSVVLTAAHKVEGRQPTDIKIRAGEWDIQFQEVGVRNIVIHQHFYGRSKTNNVALLFLERPVLRAPNVDLVCLGRSLPPAGTTCYSMGWGKDRFGDSRKILKVEVPIVSREECENKYKRTRLGLRFQLHASFICAGGIEGVDTCKGDGGSPLVCAIDGKGVRYAQYGGVSWAIGCGELPRVYTDYVFFKEWIVKKVTDEGLDAKIFTLH